MNKEIEYYEFRYKIPKYKIKPPLDFSKYYQIHKDEIIIDLQQENQKYKEVIDKATNELFILKDMIYKPETREENFEIQRKISSIIKRLNGKEVSK